jgi:hypothetical protein
MTRLITDHGTAPVTAPYGETLRELLTTSWDGADDVEPAPGHPRLLHRLRCPPAMA